MRRKGVVYTWIIILISIFIISIVWIIFSQVLVPEFFPTMGEQLAAYPQTMDTYTSIKNVWDYWPLILIGGLIFYGFARSQKKEYDTGYYP